MDKYKLAAGLRSVMPAMNFAGAVGGKDQSMRKATGQLPGGLSLTGRDCGEFRLIAWNNVIAPKHLIPLFRNAGQAS